MHRARAALLAFLSLAPAVALLASVPVTEAHHGPSRVALTWEPAGNATLEFSLTLALARSTLQCRDVATGNATACTGVDGRAGPGDVVAFSWIRLRFGDGRSVPVYEFLVESVDAGRDEAVARALDRQSFPLLDATIAHEYETNGTFVASLHGCCRRSMPPASSSIAFANNAGGPILAEVVASVGTGDRPPAAEVPPRVACVSEGLCTVHIPATDPEGSPVRLRLAELATDFGSPFVQPGPPLAPNAARIDGNVLSWNVTGARLGRVGATTVYAAHVVAETLAPDGTVTASSAYETTFELSEALGRRRPRFEAIGWPCTDGSFPAPEQRLVRGVVVETNVWITFRVTDADADSLTVRADGAPSGAELSPVETWGGPGWRLAWKPTWWQQGTHRFDLVVEDGTGLASRCPVEVVAVRSLPTPPRNFTARAGPGAGEVTLAWDPPADDGGAPVGTVIARVLDEPDEWGNTVRYEGLAVGERSVIVGALADGTTYRFYAHAYHVAGWSAPSLEASARTFARPGAPDASAAPSTHLFGPLPAVRVTWTPPTDDGGTPVESYSVHRLGADGNWTHLATVEANVTRFEDAVDPLFSTEYRRYAVTARNLVGEGPRSSLACASAVPAPFLGEPCASVAGTRDVVLADFGLASEAPVSIRAGPARGAPDAYEVRARIGAVEIPPIAVYTNGRITQEVALDGVGARVTLVARHDARLATCALALAEACVAPAPVDPGTPSWDLGRAGSAYLVVRVEGPRPIVLSVPLAGQAGALAG